MQFDSIKEKVPGVSISATKSISYGAPYLADHFPKKPVLPMTVLLECKLNLARDFVARSWFSENYKIYELRKIKMNEFVLPGDIIECQLTVKKQTADELMLAFRRVVKGKRVCVVDVVLIARGK